MDYIFYLDIPEVHSGLVQNQIWTLSINTNSIRVKKKGTGKHFMETSDITAWVNLTGISHRCSNNKKTYTMYWVHPFSKQLYRIPGNLETCILT